MIDELMKNLRSIIRKTQVTVIAACHLSNPAMGIDWEDGREVKQKDFRGSGALRQYPDIMVGIERNMRDPQTKDQSRLRIIKNREYGANVGVCDILLYNETTGRLINSDKFFG